MIAFLIEAINQGCIQPIVQGFKRYLEVQHHFRVVMSHTGYYQRRELLQVKALPAPKGITDER